MTTCRSTVEQSREVDKDHELINDAAWHCPVSCLGFEYRGSATVNFDCKELFNILLAIRLYRLGVFGLSVVLVPL